MQRQLFARAPLQVREIKLKHLRDFWELMFDQHEPNYELTHIAYCEPMPEEDFFQLYNCLERWDQDDLRNLSRWLKTLLTTKLLDDEAASNQKLSHWLYALEEDYRLVTEDFFPQGLELRYAKDALRPINARRGLEEQVDLRFAESTKATPQRPHKGRRQGRRLGFLRSMRAMAPKIICSSSPKDDA